VQKNVAVRLIQVVIARDGVCYGDEKNMNSAQLSYFAAAVESGSLSAAASAECVSVQAVSKSILDLEKDVGAQLLNRTNSGVFPTAFGEIYYRKTLKVLAAVSELDTMTHGGVQKSPEQSVLLAVSSFPPFRGIVFSRAGFRDFNVKCPDVGLRLLFAAPAVCSSALDNNAVEIALIIGPWSRPACEAQEITRITPKLLVCSGHPLARRKLVTTADMREYPIAFPGDCGFLFQRLNAESRKNGFEPRFVQVASTLEQSRSFVEESFGLMFVADDVEAARLYYPGSVLKDTDLPDIPVFLATRKRLASHSVALVKDYIMDNIDLLLAERVASASDPLVSRAVCN